MASIQAITMPKWGMTMVEGKLAGWFVAQGARIAAAQDLMEVETEKITNVVESPASGVIRRRRRPADAAHPRLRGADDRLARVFLERLFARGLRPILFDNRDIGLSQKFRDARDFDAGYTFDGLADDAFGVLDAIGLSSAQVIGQSMGGMVAQIMAPRRPQRVRSLCLVYAAPGFGPYLERRSRALDDPATLYVPRPHAEALEAFVERECLARSTAYRFDEAWIRGWAERSFARCYAPAGAARQAAAMRRLPERFEGLEEVRLPALTLHSREDLHIDVAAAFDLRRRLADSEPHVYSGLRHEIAGLLDGTAMIRGAGP